ncbi:ABC transporter ATP-binding protein [Desulfospira joergensenii]|uniref:ABC transporter ATP-binding protein n=1 Tax=Desulfospira joergensenii TaxID=53329 RepID=UPI0003B33215|nr:ATP-binding cassette domain-containing protein [Desulfospira joergensenii]
MEPALIEFKNIKKSFGTNHVLKGINLSITKGLITAIIGKSGTGKSVLLKHIIGLIQPDSGQLLFEGQPIDHISRKKKNALQRDLSYMFQDNALFDFMNIYDNIALPLKEARRQAGQTDISIRDKVDQRMNQLGLEGIQEKFPQQLSGGMKKRVALARALVTNPKIVLFDEPTTGLDPVRKRNVHTMIQEYQEKFGFTAVIVSHDIPEIFDVAQKIAMLDEGLIIFEGTRDELFTSDSDRLNHFIHGRES